jgi:hypothetical protein
MFVYLLINMALFVSCHKESARINVAAKEYFPNTVGNYWEYQVYDSSQIREHPEVPRQYSVKVSISGTKTLADNTTATVWKYDLPWGAEFSYVRIVDDSIKVYDELRANGLAYMNFPSDLYITPFSDNKKWNSNLLWTDSFFVHTQPLASYPNALKVHRDYIGQQTYFNDDFWFEPKIGFVVKKFNERNQGILKNEIWRLTNYILK